MRKFLLAHSAENLRNKKRPVFRRPFLKLVTSAFADGRQFKEPCISRWVVGFWRPKVPLSGAFLSRQVTTSLNKVYRFFKCEPSYQARQGKPCSCIISENGFIFNEFLPGRIRKYSFTGLLCQLVI